MENKGYLVKDVSEAMTGKIELGKSKRYSIIAMNLETTEDVEKVIRQCESLKEQMTGGSLKLSITENGTIIAK